MKKPIERLLFWIPRLLGILEILFISLLALNTFNQGYTFWRALTAFAIRMVPVLILMAVLAIAWRREIIGGLLFIALGVLLIARIILGRFSLASIFTAAFPLILLGSLFLAHWVYRIKPQQGC
ncbi:MAG: hypothetical protein HPY45_10140 [Anaerolineae bacterium]|nr:hypothetical protein [Anaerolineae bacterium]